MILILIFIPLPVLTFANCMEIKTATYVGSYPTLAKCPKPKQPEYAFIGRSNVGKSSLINMLSQRKSLALVSKTPGKTQMINFFLMDDSWYVVDLPGYGYARRSKGLRKSFQDMIYSYFRGRESLYCAFVLIDSNIPPQENDMEFINWMGKNQVPFAIVYTKVDRLTKRLRKENIERIQSKILETWEELPQQFVTSSEKREGGDEILQFIHEVNQSG